MVGEVLVGAGNRRAACEIFGLEALAVERGVTDDEQLAELVQDVVFRTGSRRFREALGVDDSLEPEQVVSFFFEFGQGYVSARYYGDRSTEDAVEAGIRRLQTVDAARTFALARLTTSLGTDDATIESVRAHLAPHVAKWWLPDAVVLVDSLPKTGTGKYQKHQVRAMFKDAFSPASTA